ncbi:MAG: gluconate 2-dehydrogenase subunit 3 family protein [Opitutaceae bacterium]|jgi:hypothetical protein|nr:gluconate 2-dehydrogenase subunit 3 family protein [Opitutaceae bacterium]
MNRRQAIKSTALIGGGFLFLPPLLRGQTSRLPRSSDAILGATEKRLLQSVVATIIPATDTPGAQELQVDQFVLLMVNDCHDAKDQAAFYSGLRDMDAFVAQHFGQPFLSCDATTRVEALKSMGGSPDASADIKAFIQITKRRTIQGYLQSEYVMTNVLPHEMIPQPYDGYYPASKLGGKV